MVRKHTAHRAAGFALALLIALPLIGASSLAVAGAHEPGLRQNPTSTALPDLTATVSALKALEMQVHATQTAIAELSATPTSPATATPAATPTPRPAPPIAEVLVGGLNIRSGPGSSFSVVGNAAAGQRFPVTGQAGNCAWLRVVLEDGTEGWISGAAAYSSLSVACSAVPAAGGGSAAVPTPTPRPATPTPRPAQAAATRAPASQPAAPASSAASASGGAVTSFEPLGNWRRGDQPYGTLTQSTAQAQSGAASAALAYDFPANAGSENYVVFLAQPELRIPAGAQSLTIQVYGDGSGHFLNAWVRDAANQVWQTTFGRINHTGWAPMSAGLTASREWPNGPISGATGNPLAAPFTLRALVLDGAPDGVASRGTIYLDALSAGSGAAAAGSSNTAAPPAASAAGQTNAAGQTDAAAAADTADGVETVAAPSGPLTGKIAFTRFNGKTMDTLIYDLATNSVINQFANWRQPDLSGGYLLVNGEGGGEEAIVRANSSGGNRRPVTINTEDAFPQFSPSLESMVYSSTKVGDRKPRLYWQADASVQQDVAPLLYSGRELFGDYPVYLDNWRIAFQGCNSWAGGSRCGIYAADTRGGEPLRATDNTSDIPSGNLGSRILFSSNRAGNWDVWVINFDGGGMQQLTTDPAIDGLGTASPDGQSIAFVSNRGGAWAVWVMNTDGSNQRKLFDIGGGYGGGDYDWIRERISWGT